MTKKHLIIDAIVSINPNAKVSVLNNNYEEIIWGNTSVISKEVINKKIIQLDDNYNAKQYQRDRAKAYPSIQEQLDMQYWDKVNGTDNWEQAINAVKAQYPKS